MEGALFLPGNLPLLGAVLAASTVFAQSPVTIRVPVRVVTVPTAVVSPKGQFVRDLQARDFSVFDNDLRQSLRLDYVDEPLSLAVVVQVSDPVRAWLPLVRRAGSVVETLLLGATGEASLTVYSDEVKVIQPLTEDSGLLDRVFRQISLTGSASRTVDAVASAAHQLAQVSSQRRRAILLIAQAGDEGSESRLADVLRDLEINNISVYSLVMPRAGKELVRKTVSLQDAKDAFHRNDVGFMVGLDLGKLVPEIYRAKKAGAGENDLSVVTSETGGRQIPFRKLRDLEAGVSAIGEELHTEYVLSYTPGRYEPGYHRVRVEVIRPEAAVRARPGYYVLQSDAAQ